MLTGENGIIRQSQDAKEETIISNEKEQVKIAYSAVKISKLDEDITTAELQTELDKLLGENKTEVSDNGDGTLNVKFNDTGNNYDISNGEVIKSAKINWNAILADATANPNNYKHTEQSATNGDIGIGTDGKSVNLDLWTYEVINGNEIKLSGSGGCGGSPGYQNANIIEGKIIGTVPQYIKVAGNNDFYAVTSMGRIISEGTFSGCTSLIIAPEIPSSVTEMGYTFQDCTGLTMAPEIPLSVTDMRHTFRECTALTIAPKIPSSVTNMEGTFYGCKLLSIAPEIPLNVINMDSTFSSCKSLTTAPKIPSSVTDMSNTFSYCTNLTIAPEIPLNVTNMHYTFFSCTSLIIAPEIPSNVTNMYYTFCDCKSLTTVTAIPSSVINMRGTFYNCAKLQGTIEINANPTNYYSYCFENAATDGTGLVVTGLSTMLDKLIETKSSNSNIIKGT